MEKRVYRRALGPRDDLPGWSRNSVERKKEDSCWEGGGPCFSSLNSFLPPRHRFNFLEAHSCKTVSAVLKSDCPETTSLAT